MSDSFRDGLPCSPMTVLGGLLQVRFGPGFGDTCNSRSCGADRRYIGPPFASRDADASHRARDVSWHRGPSLFQVDAVCCECFLCLRRYQEFDKSLGRSGLGGARH
jgi:hypothetical protein